MNNELTQDEKKEIRHYNNGEWPVRRCEQTKNIVFKEMPKEYINVNRIEYYCAGGDHLSRRTANKEYFRLKNGKLISIFHTVTNDPEWQETYYWMLEKN